MPAGAAADSHANTKVNTKVDTDRVAGVRSGADAAGECGVMQRALSPAQAQKFRAMHAACGGAFAPPARNHAEAPAPRVARQLALSGRAVAAVPAPLALQPVPRSRPVAAPRSSRVRPAAATAARALQMSPLLDEAAAAHRIDPLLLHAVAQVESSYNPQAVSHAGARGLMQVMPATGQRFGVGAAASLHDARVNVDAAARYLKTLQGRFGNDLPLVLAAYNAGEGAVERYGRRIPPYAETRSYVSQVLRRYEHLLRIRAGAAQDGLLAAGGV